MKKHCYKSTGESKKRAELNLILDAFISTFKSRRYLLIGISSIILMFGFSLLIIYFFTPSILRIYSFSTLQFGWIVILSLLFGISISLQFHASHLDKIRKTKENFVEKTGTGFITLFASLFSFHACPFCLIALIGLAGASASTALLLFSYRTYIFIIAIILLLISIYFTTKRINNCNFCKR